MHIVYFTHRSPGHEHFACLPLPDRPNNAVTNILECTHCALCDGSLELISILNVIKNCCTIECSHQFTFPSAVFEGAVS